MAFGMGCQSGTSSQSQEDPAALQGRLLAQVYCQSCHQLPDPDLLDKDTWFNGVLPAMGPRLGIFNYLGIPYPSQKGNPYLEKNFYPSAPILTQKQWGDILEYYYTLAPDHPLPQPKHLSIKKGLHLFSLEIPRERNPLGPTTTLVKIDPVHHFIYVADARKKLLMTFNNKLRRIDSVATLSPVTWIHFQHGLSKSGISDGWVTSIGILNPSEEKLGTLQSLSVSSRGQMRLRFPPILDSLHRPVQILQADLNQDGRKDFLVLDFGNLTGSLFWMENLGMGKYKKHLLRGEPGAIKAYIRTNPKTGRPDIWALFAQGDEGIFLYQNRGGGKFEEKKLLGFPPVYGSSYFELDDFNQDGFPDILYTCGDNADFSKVLKPFHGIYIFLNDGKNHFTQKYFYPINGCYKAVARDFDGQGNLDIAAISYFADYAHRPKESLVYLKNEGNFQFQPYSLKGYNLGRWLTMDVGDLYGNGWDDIILGNFSEGPTNIRAPNHWKEGPPFIVLKNNSPPKKNWGFPAKN
ncbi:MAG: FG-GAP repeat domain-containing protein [Chitinophagaceae bacterium]